MKQCLFRGWQALSVVLIAFLGVVAAASTGPGYLPRVGPVPLRFSPAPRPRLNRFVLPVPAPAPEPVPVVSQVEKAPPAHSLLLPPISPEPPAGVLAQPPVDSSPPDTVVSPQMLLKFFSKSTNTAPSGGAPVDFNPPKTAGPLPAAINDSSGK
jgi:hypothetical protein